MFRDLLVHVTADQTGESRLRYALAMAASFGARLSGAHVLAERDIPPVFKPSMLDRVERSLAAREVEDAKKARQLFDSIAMGYGDVRWYGLQGRTIGALCERARYADVVIVGPEATEASPERDPMSVADHLVMSSGRPILLIPPGHGYKQAPQRVLVAWDGSREAVRAIHDAMPLLRSSSVALVIVSGSDAEGLSKDIAEGSDLIDHLERHGIRVERKDVRNFAHHETAAVMTQLADTEVDLVVMGAYGHPIWREFLFGGTTAVVTRRASVPVFMSH